MGLLDDKNNRYTLRPMQYPQFYDYYLNALKNHWTVEEISFTTDVADIREKLTEAETHVVMRLVAFFATGDNIVADNAVLNLYRFVNSPEARMYYSRQIFEEGLHIQFYLQLLDNYLPDDKDRFEAFDAINNIPSVKRKAEFCFRWMGGEGLDLGFTKTDTDEKRTKFLMNLITFGAAVEGIFFMGAFSYVYYLRSRGLLNGLADGTNWVFRDETMHMNFCFDVVKQIKLEYPHLWTAELKDKIVQMLHEAIECEMSFAEDALSLGVAGLSTTDMRQFLEFCVDLRLHSLGMDQQFGSRNPFPFMELQNLEGLANFFERTVSQYQIGIRGGEEQVNFEEDDF